VDRGARRAAETAARSRPPRTHRSPYSDSAGR
jgi:hypothetical protein